MGAPWLPPSPAKTALSPANAPAAPGLPRPVSRPAPGRCQAVAGSVALTGSMTHQPHSMGGAPEHTGGPGGVTEGTSTLDLLPTWVAGLHPLRPALHLRHRPGPLSTL